MTTVSSSIPVPPALQAVEALPLLWQQAQESLVRQGERIHERTAGFVPRLAVLTQIDQAIRGIKSGLVCIEGASGSGVTTLLCFLAATRRYAFWFTEDDAGQGAGALAAQLVALGDLPVHLVPPAVDSDAKVLEELLTEVAEQRSADDPLIVLIDGTNMTHQALHPSAIPFPAQLPAHVVVVYGCEPGATLPFPPTARISLGVDDETIDAIRKAVTAPLPTHVREALVSGSGGNFLYLKLAQNLLNTGIIASEHIPTGLEELHRAWWKQLGVTGQRLALLLAAAGEPLPHDLCAELLGDDPEPLFHQWAGLVTSVIRDSEEEPTYTSAFYHSATSAFVARQARKELAQAHKEIAMLTQREVMDERPRDVLKPIVSSLSWETSGYLLRQFARHAFWSPAVDRASLLPLVANRTWVRLQQRRGSPLAAARDGAWELWGATSDGPLGRLARSTFLAGSLATLARFLPPDAPAEALIMALDTPERDVTLKRILSICDQLPDGRDKAALLRRLGEVCYSERRMRTAAMRLLSQAIDLEAQTPSKAWRDEREQLLAILALAALANGNWKEALEITPRISHTERRGMAETEVVRALIGMNELERAELVAHGIVHESLRAWAQAEVVVAHANADNLQGADALLETISLETANAWAQIEVACHEAGTDEEAAKARIEGLPGVLQRDRGRTRLAHALAQVDKDGDALAMAEQISGVAERVTALLDLRLTLEGLVAMLALEQATAVISALEGDDRVPLICALAEAHAALGRSERALAIADQLADDEERDRALARVAVALAGSGDYTRAQEVVQLLRDVDERDWALDELARMLGRAAEWDAAYQRGKEITDEDQRAKTLADLAIEQGRQGESLIAHGLALSIDHPAERVRALTALVPLLITAGHSQIALATQEYFPHPDARSRYQTVLTIALLEHASRMPRQQAATIWAEARKLALTISRPAERVRALIALAHGAIDHNPVLAQATLGLALRTAASNRPQALRSLQWAAPTLTRLGGARLLVDVATAIDEIDKWLHS